MNISTRRLSSCFTCLLLLMSTSSYTQLSGRVLTTSGEPVPFANIIILHAVDSSIVEGYNADEDGSFIVPLTHYNQPYIIEVSSLGAKTFYSDAFQMDMNKPGFDFGNILLEDEVTALGEVVVAARKNFIQTTPTGKTINVQSSLLTQGSNTLQVIEKLPGVLVDRQNGQFSLMGQGGANILFNGRKVNLPMSEIMALLESSSADGIEKIELITSPTARYDADGGSSLINIIFKKNTSEGSSGSLSFGAAYGIYEKGNASFSFDHKKEKLSFSASYSAFRNHNKNGFQGGGVNNMPFIGGQSTGTFSTYFTSAQFNQNATVDLAYSLNARTNTGISLSFIHGINNSTADIFNTRKVIDQDLLKISILSLTNTKKTNSLASFFIDHRLSDKTSINFDANYITYYNNSPANINSTYFDENNQEIQPELEVYAAGFRSTSKTNIGIGNIKLDLNTSFGSKTNAAFGIKASIGDNNNDSNIETLRDGLWTIDPRSQSTIAGREDLLAAYAQFDMSFGAKHQLSFGLRQEYWHREVSTSTNDFTIHKIFPNIRWNYQAGENTQFQLDYNKRITRPDYVDVVASLFYNDPTAVFTGNPLLRPRLIERVQAQLSTSLFTIALSAQRETDPIIRYQLTSNEARDILIISPQNADFHNSLNLTTTLPLQWARWAHLDITSVTSLRRYQISYSVNPAAKTFLTHSLTYNQNFSLPKNFTMELSGFHHAAAYEGTNRRKGFGVLNFGLNKKFKSSSLSFTVADVLKSFDIRTHISGMTPIVFDINTNSRYRDESAFSRIYRLTWIKNFGSLSSGDKRSFGNEEEKDRME